ncbi:MAG: hypothetical protein ACI9O5_001867, partial [Algoriphagus sp.]
KSGSIITPKRIIRIILFLIFRTVFNIELIKKA